MNDREELERAEDGQQEAGPYVPATFEKRAAAWMGLAYVLMMLAIVTFSIFTGGKGLPGTFPLLLIPVAAAAAAVALHRAKTGTVRGGWAAAVVIVIVCAAAVLLALITGGPALVQALRTAYQ